MQTTSPALEENARRAPVDAGHLAAHTLPGASAIAPHPELQALPGERRLLPRLRRGHAAASDPVRVLRAYAYAYVADTRTLVPPSAPGCPATFDLLADTEIVGPRATRRVGADEDAWGSLRAERRDLATGGFMPRDVMLVTDLSRSAGAGRTLEPGAHGPRRPHVVPIEDDPAALTPEGHARCAPTPSPGPATNSPSPSTRSASAASRPAPPPRWRARSSTRNCA